MMGKKRIKIPQDVSEQNLKWALQVLGIFPHTKMYLAIKAAYPA